MSKVRPFPAHEVARYDRLMTIAVGGFRAMGKEGFRAMRDRVIERAGTLAMDPLVPFETKFEAMLTDIGLIAVCLHLQDMVEVNAGEANRPEPDSTPT